MVEAIRRFVYWLILIPAALLFIAFALANRQRVFLFLNPLPGFQSGADLPLFLIIFLCLFLGALIGAFIAWNAQRPWRTLARRQAREIDELRSQLHQFKTNAPPQSVKQDWQILPPL
jgi:uncharacterized integral membrane protein